MNTMITDLGGSDFVETVSTSPIPILVDFWAPWCGPCKQLAPVLEEIAREFEGRLRVTKVDIDAHPELAQHHQIMGIPAMLVFSDGRLVREIVGSKSKKALLKELRPLV